MVNNNVWKCPKCNNLQSYLAFRCIKKEVYWLYTHSVKVLWRYVLPNAKNCLYRFLIKINQKKEIWLYFNPEISKKTAENTQKITISHNIHKTTFLTIWGKEAFIFYINFITISYCLEKSFGSIKLCFFLSDQILCTFWIVFEKLKSFSIHCKGTHERVLPSVLFTLIKKRRKFVFTFQQLKHL